jgi:hypothetical protein
LWNFTILIFCLFSYRVNAYLFLVSSQTFIVNFAVCESEQSVILADTYIQAWMNVCASLTNENIATLSNLTIMHLGSETLGTGITAVLSAGNPLLMGE